MLFNSITFIIFFTVFFLLYWSALGRSLRGQNLLLLAGSLLFYGWWDVRFLFLLLLTICSSFFTAIKAEQGRRKLWTASNITLNLLILCLFKYFNFFSENLIAVIRAFGFEPDWFTIDVLLPVGISFYTFQAIGYSVDVYRGGIKAERNFVDFAVFLSFFPQLVAGPIERASSLLPQIKHARAFDYNRTVQGMRQALWGLVKKVVIADACAGDVSYVFDDGIESLSAFKAAYGVLLFSVQIYCDFSGYCDIARGSANCLGINLMQNFKNPYFAENVQQFWRRWNASLMLWFHSYVYIPLGGSRRGAGRTYINIMAVFILSGLWHGAAWNFVLWGLYLAVAMVLYRVYARNIKPRLPRGPGEDCTYAPAVMISSLVAVVGWLMFRSQTMPVLGAMLSKAVPPLVVLFVSAALALFIWRLVTRKRRRAASRLLCVIAIVAYGAFFAHDPVRAVYYYLPVFITLMFVIEWRYRKHDFTLQTMPANPILRYGAYFVMITLLLVSYAEDVPFIYFQF